MQSELYLNRRKLRGKNFLRKVFLKGPGQEVIFISGSEGAPLREHSIHGDRKVPSASKRAKNILVHRRYILPTLSTHLRLRMGFPMSCFSKAGQRNIVGVELGKSYEILVPTEVLHKKKAL